MLHLRKIRSAELENTLRYLNQKQSFALLFYLEHYLRNQIEPEMAARAALFILKSYEVQIKMTEELLPLLKSISVHLKASFKDFRGMVGINKCGLAYLRKQAKDIQSGSGLGGLDFEKPEGIFEF